MGNKYTRVVKNVGRPSKFTPERVASILDDIAHHIPYVLAAEGNGIVEETLYDWIKHGQMDEAAGIDSDYAKFSKAIKRTEIEKIKQHSTKISQNVDRWQADAWLLERRWYKHFGANAQLNEMNARLERLEQGENDARQLHGEVKKAAQVQEESQDTYCDGED